MLDCGVEHLRRWEDLSEVVRRDGTLIARGNGRSYGDAALNRNLTLSTLAMDRMVAFDAASGLLTCESGTLLSEILHTFAPRGWMPPVVPGTAAVTVGGMIAADVHGKNHHRDGSFGRYVESLTLLAGDGRTLRCTRTENRDAFLATVGGMGLTGVIVCASFRMKRIETGYLTAETVATPDLDTTMALFEDSAEWPYSVAWIDCLAQGAKAGRSLVSRAAFANLESLPPRLAHRPFGPANQARLAIPADVPVMLLDFAAKPFNALYYRSRRARSGPRLTHYGSYFFPLDRVAAWNRLYGRQGFLQFQCVVPKSESAAGLRRLLDCIATARDTSFLAVLKLLGSEGEGMMSFPMDGYTLALDIPLRNGTAELMRSLDAMTHEHGGRVYLAKDACSAPEHLRQGYPRHRHFQSVRAALAAGKPKFASALSERLAL